MARPRLRPRTYLRYEQLLRLQVLPSLGSIRLAKLSPQVIQGYLNGMLVAGLSPRTAQFTRAVLRRALSQALTWNLVARNPAALVDAPRVRRPEVQPFDVQQARLILEAARGHRLEALFTLALALGLRQGELLGLRWPDVDLDAGRLTITRQLQRIGGKLALTEPKSERSRRTLTLPAFVAEALRAHKVRQLEERLRTGPAWHDDGFVFTSTIGTPIDTRNLVRHYHQLLQQGRTAA